MACISFHSAMNMALAFLFFSMAISPSSELSTSFYKTSCPHALATVKRVVKGAILNETRMGASLLRLHFHDCFVNGCDGSILLDDNATFIGEQTARPNINSVRGFNIVAEIKTAVEKICPGVVSCADILAMAARDSVVILGGPKYKVKLGRRDSLNANFTLANSGGIPSFLGSLQNLTTRFNQLGLSVRDLVALSGAHTIGDARCVTFRSRIYNETNIDTEFAEIRQETCPESSSSGSNNLAPLDIQTPDVFDNYYYKNLVNLEGLLHSDQVLYNNASTDSLVETYSTDRKAFFADFVVGMLKMGDITPLTGTQGEIRKVCSVAY